MAVDAHRISLIGVAQIARVTPAAQTTTSHRGHVLALAEAEGEAGDGKTTVQDAWQTTTSSRLGPVREYASTFAAAGVATLPCTKNNWFSKVQLSGSGVGISAVIKLPSWMG